MYKGEFLTMKIHILIAAFLFNFHIEIVLQTKANAQEITSEESRDPRLVQAELDAALAQASRDQAQAEQAEAEARRARIAANLPSSETTGVEGNITVGDGAGYYAEILAYDSLKNVAGKIANEIAEEIEKEKEIILIGSTDLSAEVALHEFITSEIERVKILLNSIKNNSDIKNYTKDDKNAFELIGKDDDENEFAFAGAALTALPQALGAARDIAQFFQTDISISNRTVSLNDNALTTNLIGQLISKKLKPILPRTSTKSVGTLSKEFGELQTLRNELSSLRLIAETRAEKQRSLFANELAITMSKLDALRAELAALVARKDKTEDDKNRITVLQGSESPIVEATYEVRLVQNKQSELERIRTLILAHLNAGITTADALTTTLTTANSMGVTPFQTVSIINYIKSKAGAYLLFTDIVSQGGEVQTINRAFSGRITYAGGATVSYILLKNDGNAVAADTHTNVKTASFKRRKVAKGISRD